MKDIDPLNKDKYRHIDRLHLGKKLNDYINTNEFGEIQRQHFKARCLQFLVTLSFEMKTRFKNFQDNFWDYLDCLLPKNALSGTYRTKNLDIMDKLVPKFERVLLNTDIDRDAVYDEWQDIIVYELPEELKDEDIDIDKFWSSLLHFQSHNGNFPFKNICKFAINVLLTPHSNAEPERIFSKVNLTHTRTRNSLKTKTINGILLASQCVKYDGSNCKSFEPTENMYKLMGNLRIVNNLNNNNNQNNNENARNHNDNNTSDDEDDDDMNHY